MYKPTAYHTPSLLLYFENQCKLTLPDNGQTICHTFIPYHELFQDLCDIQIIQPRATIGLYTHETSRQFQTLIEKNKACVQARTAESFRITFGTLGQRKQHQCCIT